MARWLNLCQSLSGSAFTGVELPDDVASTMSEMVVSADMLIDGETLRAAVLPEKSLIIMVKRKDGAYVVPKGDTRLHVGDALLLIKQK